MLAKLSYYLLRFEPIITMHNSINLAFQIEFFSLVFRVILTSRFLVNEGLSTSNSNRLSILRKNRELYLKGLLTFLTSKLGTAPAEFLSEQQFSDYFDHFITRKVDDFHTKLGFPPELLLKDRVNKLFQAIFEALLSQIKAKNFEDVVIDDGFTLLELLISLNKAYPYFILYEQGKIQYGAKVFGGHLVQPSPRFRGRSIQDLIDHLFTLKNTLLEE
eukprot:TRINITY_DN8187_c0_g1_i4.p1 TRINITY_DN8187_c0_g1~~TRINITY_DN8187_c0_g1_i4.p1  ORF type:complete len:217 (-),score=12.32 TRINITY_DN8187_c0_g1_i4:122-772(-)